MIKSGKSKTKNKSNDNLDEKQDRDVEKTNSEFKGGVIYEKRETSTRSSVTMNSGESTIESEKVKEDNSLHADEENNRQTEIGMIVSYEEEKSVHTEIESDEENTIQPEIVFTEDQMKKTSTTKRSNINGCCECDSWHCCGNHSTSEDGKATVINSEVQDGEATVIGSEVINLYHVTTTSEDGKGCFECEHWPCGGRNVPSTSEDGKAAVIKSEKKREYYVPNVPSTSEDGKATVIDNEVQNRYNIPSTSEDREATVIGSEVINLYHVPTTSEDGKGCFEDERWPCSGRNVPTISEDGKAAVINREEKNRYDVPSTTSEDADEKKTLMYGEV